MDTRKSRRFYVMVVQAVLLFRSETWVVIPNIKRLLAGVHNMVAQRILGKMPRWRASGTWEYYPLGV